jgi:hypothetical protein
MGKILEFKQKPLKKFLTNRTPLEIILENTLLKERVRRLEAELVKHLTRGRAPYDR